MKEQEQSRDIGYRGQRTGDKEQRHKTEDLGWETKFKEGTTDV
jgi:hypothetical protein